ncbi:MAG: 30S ribosomal protein S6--L-glutamate ligase [Gammaproteobacteria bacterium]|nr:30S ribosomal protein S6--L-glutamate ligase [Gammaproteobacteria bacterium]
MKLAILSRNRKLYSTRRLVEAAQSRGHTVRVVDPLRCYMRISPGLAEIHYKGKVLEGSAAIIPRIGASITFYGTAVVRQFRSMGVYTVNGSDGIGRARDKLRSMQLLSQQGIGLPTTVCADSPDDTDDLVAMLGEPPHVLKLVEGTQGQGVVLAETESASISLAEAFRGVRAHFLMQEFIREAKGADLRAFVVGGKVVATMMRQAREGEFRSNLHRGGSALRVKLTREEHTTAVRAATTMGLGVAGVDLLRSDRGPLVLEVNSSPGLEGIEGASGIDVAGVIIEYVERSSRRHKR